VKIGLIITAAGSARRFGSNKLLEKMGDLTVLSHCVSQFVSIGEIQDIVVTANTQSKRAFETELATHHLPARVIFGGETRQASVSLAFQALEPCDVVMIHDAARPWVSQDLIHALIQAIGQHNAVVPALPLNDTIKEVRGERVVRTVDRDSLRAIQTPQIFKYDVLKRAYARDYSPVTDEAMLVESLGELVYLIPGDPRNIKITLPEDMAYALVR
jgi:2-C-methyl-D-erythritol 4-phosphate cytidylyltransferase